MKKLLALFMTLAMVAVCFAGCGKKQPAKVIKSAKDLPGARIGVQLGTTGDIYASDYEKEGSTIKRFSKGADAVMALKSGKLDCVIIDSEPAKAFVKANEGLKILKEPFETEQYAMCFAKDNEKLLKEVNGALEELIEDGTVDSIIKNFIGDDTKGKSPYVSPKDVDTSKGTLTMVTNAFFEPYEYYKGDKIVGIDASIAQAICDKLGYKLEIKDVEFDSILNEVTAGKADFGMAGMTVTDERLEEVNFSTPYTTATQVIIVNE